jgi:hypothetical protein
MRHACRPHDHSTVLLQMPAQRDHERRRARRVLPRHLVQYVECFALIDLQTLLLIRVHGSCWQSVIMTKKDFSHAICRAK